MKSKKEISKKIYDSLSFFLLNDYLKRKGFYSIYEEIKEDFTIDYIKEYFDKLFFALKFFEKQNKTYKVLFNDFIKENFKNYKEEDIERFCTDIYFIIINEYPKSKWQMHKIAELFYAYKPSSKKIVSGFNKMLDSISTFGEDLEKAKEKGKHDAEELLKKYPLKKEPLINKIIKPIKLSSRYIDKLKTISLLHKGLIDNGYIKIQLEEFKHHFFNNIQVNSFKKIQWYGSEPEIVDLFDNINLYDRNYYKLIENHFINKKGKCFKNTQLSTVSAKNQAIHLQINKILQIINRQKG